MDIYFEAFAQGYPVFIGGTTKRGDIMPEICEDNEITAAAIRECVTAKGFNSCFSTSSKREFAKGCRFNNVVFVKREINDKTNNAELDSATLAELRRSKKRLAEFLK